MALSEGVAPANVPQVLRAGTIESSLAGGSGPVIKGCDDAKRAKTMTKDRLVRRYAAFFKGWAQAFGEHEKIADERHHMRWLLGDAQVGLILEPAIKRALYPHFLGHKPEDVPPILLHRTAVEMGGARLELGDHPEPPLPELFQLLSQDGELHLFQTYHLVYASGTRILTLSARAPMGILYRELPALTVRWVED